MGLVKTPKEFLKAVEYLKREFKIKHLGKTRYCLNLLIDYKINEALIYQFIYVEKILKHFSMDNAHLLSTPIVVISLDPKKNLSHPKNDDGEILGFRSTITRCN